MLHIRSHPLEVQLAINTVTRTMKHAISFHYSQGSLLHSDFSLGSPFARLPEVDGCYKGDMDPHFAFTLEVGKPFRSTITVSVISLSNPVVEHLQGPCVVLHSVLGAQRLERMVMSSSMAGVLKLHLHVRMGSGWTHSHRRMQCLHGAHGTEWTRWDASPQSAFKARSCV